MRTITGLAWDPLSNAEQRSWRRAGPGDSTAGRAPRKRRQGGRGAAPGPEAGTSGARLPMAGKLPDKSPLVSEGCIAAPRLSGEGRGQLLPAVGGDRTERERDGGGGGGGAEEGPPRRFSASLPGEDPQRPRWRAAPCLQAALNARRTPVLGWKGTMRPCRPRDRERRHPPKERLALLCIVGGGVAAGLLLLPLCGRDSVKGRGCEPGAVRCVWGGVALLHGEGQEGPTHRVERGAYDGMGVLIRNRRACCRNDDWTDADDGLQSWWCVCLHGRARILP